MIDAFTKFKQVVVRVSLLRALNLAAQANQTDMKRRLAGYTAYSSADPYPYLLVGDGRNDTNNCKGKILKGIFVDFFSFDQND